MNMERGQGVRLTWRGGTPEVGLEEGDKNCVRHVLVPKPHDFDSRQL